MAMTSAEKQAHANEAEKVWNERIVQDVLDEFAWNNKLTRAGFTEYGFAKIVSKVAQCARAQALGISTAELLLTPAEFVKSVGRMAGREW